MHILVRDDIILQIICRHIWIAGGWLIINFGACLLGWQKHTIRSVFFQQQIGLRAILF